jgi:hypothetical protein
MQRLNGAGISACVIEKNFERIVGLGHRVKKLYANIHEQALPM